MDSSIWIVVIIVVIISTGQFGVNIKGKIIDIKENWMKVETRNGKSVELINADFVQSIKVI